MTAQSGPGAPVFPSVPPPPPHEMFAAPAAPPGPSERAVQWRLAGALAALLLVIGALLGVVWAAWAPEMPPGLVLDGGIERSESTAFMAADVRYAVIVSIVGALAGAAAWWLRRARGPVLPVGLAVGGVGGAYLTELVGSWVQGGSSDAAVGTVIDHLALEVQIGGLRLAEAAIAVLVYSLFVAFTAADDLGRPDERRGAQGWSSVGPEHGPQGGWAHRNGPGAPQQDHFPPQ